MFKKQVFVLTFVTEEEEENSISAVAVLVGAAAAAAAAALAAASAAASEAAAMAAALAAAALATSTWKVFKFPNRVNYVDHICFLVFNNVVTVFLSSKKCCATKKIKGVSCRFCSRFLVGRNCFFLMCIWGENMLSFPKEISSSKA